ncbi:MAG: hypothetical protein MUC59_08140 [Saprospiraceae bacterium]|jgi:hypothetical protein|nr:hypothetical protein [Saprospiraceae bacterium]
MKNTFFYCCLATLLSCAVRPQTQSIQLLSKETVGFFSLQCDGKGDSRSEAETDAKRFALSQILYNGLPNASISDLRLPLVEDKNKLTTSQIASANRLMDGESMNRYFTEVAWVDQQPMKTASGEKMQRFRMKVNYDLFRKDLENQGVVRKFGL